jgi:hypothetical protein
MAALCLLRLTFGVYSPCFIFRLTERKLSECLPGGARHNFQSFATEEFFKMRKFMFGILLLTLASTTAFAADFNGKWAAEIQGPKRTQNITFDLHVDGSTLTGQIILPRGSSNITDGKVNGDTITFNQVTDRQGTTVTTTYTGKAIGDKIKFSRQTGDGPAVDFVATPLK